jgi:ankyrin repeat protein
MGTSVDLGQATPQDPCYGILHSHIAKRRLGRNNWRSKALVRMEASPGTLSGFYLWVTRRTMDGQPKYFVQIRTLWADVLISYLSGEWLAFDSLTEALACANGEDEGRFADTRLARQDEYPAEHQLRPAVESWSLLVEGLPFTQPQITSAADINSGAHAPASQWQEITSSSARAVTTERFKNPIASHNETETSETSCDPSQPPLLHWAAAQDDSTQVKALLASGLAVDSRDEKEQTPLHVAAEAGHVVTLFVLLQAGAHVNVRDKSGETPLFKAVANGHLRATQLLLQRGARSNVGDWDGWRPLHEVAWRGYDKIAELLLNAGTNVHVVNQEYRDTPLMVACMENHVAIARHLYERGARIDQINQDRLTALCMSVTNGNYEVAEFLLQAGADPNFKDPDGITPLHRAAWMFHINIAELLLRFGADRKAMDEHGLSALHWAVRAPSVDGVNYLLDAGAEIGACDYKGNTPLHLACGSRVADNYMLQEEERWQDHATFCERARMKIIQRLLASGANAHIANQQGQTALDVARIFLKPSEQECLRLFLK